MSDFHTRRTVYGACGRYWAKAPDMVNEGLITASNIHPCGTCLKVKSSSTSNEVNVLVVDRGGRQGGGVQGLALSLKAISTLDKDWERFANTGCSWQKVEVTECKETRKPDRPRPSPTSSTETTANEGGTPVVQPPARTTTRKTGSGKCSMRPYHNQKTVYGACGRYWAVDPDDVNDGYITASKEFPCGTCLEVKSTDTGLSTNVLVVDAGGTKGLDLSQQAINAIDIEWYKAGNTPCSYKVVDASECQQ